MLFCTAKLAQGTDIAFIIKIQLKYHFWEEKSLFLTMWKKKYIYIHIFVYIYMYTYICIYIFIMVLTKHNHLFTYVHPSLGL